MGFEARLNYLQEFISNVTENTSHIDYETSRYLMFRGIAIIYHEGRVMFIEPSSFTHMMYVCPCIIYEIDERYPLDATIYLLLQILV